MLKIGQRVRPRLAGGPPWREGVVETISDASELRSGMNIGVRMTDASLGYLGSIAYFREDEFELLADSTP